MAYWTGNKTNDGLSICLNHMCRHIPTYPAAICRHPICAAWCSVLCVLHTLRQQMWYTSNRLLIVHVILPSRPAITYMETTLVLILTFSTIFMAEIVWSCYSIVDQSIISIVILTNSNITYDTWSLNTSHHWYMH